MFTISSTNFSGETNTVYDCGLGLRIENVRSSTN